MSQWTPTQAAPGGTVNYEDDGDIDDNDEDDYDDDDNNDDDDDDYVYSKKFFLRIIKVEALLE